MQKPNGVNKKYGDYRCVALLDRAHDSALYHALNIKTGKMFTLRVVTLRRDVHRQINLEEAHALIRQELANIMRLQYETMVSVLDFGLDEETLYMVLPMMRGNSLHNRLEARNITAQNTEGLPSLGQIAQLVRRIADALQALHQAGMVHGQVEPRAVLFDEEGAPYLADVGLIRLQKIIFQLNNTNSFSLTRYSAPELWEGNKPQPASDQYALACVAYELITGRAPFESPTLFGLMKSHVNDAVMPPHYVRRDMKLPTELAMVFWQALAKPIDRRFLQVGDLGREFERVVQGYEGEPSDFFTFPLP